MILAACFAASAALMASCTGGNTGKTSAGSESVSSSEEEFDGWTPDNILARPVEKDDIRIGSYVSFADTAKGWSGKDQVERLYYAGLNFMPMICTLPKSGMLTEAEKSYISRDLTDSKWWGKIDELMQEYNMVYYFSELSGLANDHESSVRRESMINSDAVADARKIIPNLKNCVGVKLVDEPALSSFDEFAKWARYYARITDADENGKYYGVPFYEATVGIVYDLDVFEKYGFYYAAEGYGDAEGFIQDTDGNWIGEGGKAVGKASEMSYTDALKAGVKLGNGPDGKAGTYDDGCAATYDDFFKLCLRMNARDVFPLTWPGAQETLRYLNYLAYNLWTDYEGVDQMGLNYSLSGTASDLIKLDTYNSATGTYETESVAITDANGYELQRQAGKYEAINFIKRILSDERNFDPKTCVSDTSQKDAERRFILSAAPDIKDRAMLIDGSWWQNEAKNMFEDMAVDYNNDAYRAENRRFGLLPLPKANASKVGEESALAFNTATVIFVNKKTTTDETTLKVAKQFIKFLHTHESLYEFTSTTSSARPYTYDLSDAEKSTLTSVAKHNYELHSATNFVFPYSKQTIVRSNYDRFSCSGYLVFQAYGQQETILAQRFLTNKDTTSWDYFTSMVKCQGKEFWETNFGKDIGK